MRRIAHLSDVHILDPRTRETRGARYRFATKLVGLGRKTDPLIRSRRLARALELVKANGADHIVISGDLTEVGEDGEFERFAEILHDAHLPEDAITLVPGNHDAYTSADAWTRAMKGPLARFAKASADSAANTGVGGAGAAAPGKIVDRGPVVFLPIDTSCFQTMARSSGVFSRAMAEAVDLRASDPALRDKALVLVLHHPPFHPHRVLKWIDGLRGCAHVLDLLSRHPRLQLLHGHLHRVMDRILATSAGVVSTACAAVTGATAVPPTPTRLFGAPATCDGPDEAPGLRLYDVVDGALVAVATSQAGRAA